MLHFYLSSGAPMRRAFLVRGYASAIMARMIGPGAPAPDFELPDQDGEPVRLSALRGRTVVLYFYPRADT